VKILKLLAIDTSAKSASTAITDDDRLISECFVNTKLTHSCTLMPMVNNVLSQANLKIEDIDAFCVNAGPGSFTGIRIGVAAVKGLAFKNSKPCAAVSTLESMAYNFLDEECIVCSTMDARCNQVYFAAFMVTNGEIKRFTEDDAISIDNLKEKISNDLLNNNLKIYLAGDGAELCYKSFGNDFSNVYLAAENRRYQRGYGAALAALHNNEFMDSALIMPVYLRPPQAERELKLKKAEGK
jgi:tRNA threonylcarbamoyladenosine biosynthesis protein TsaB